MIRVIIFLAALAAVALGLSWLADRPGEIVMTWQGYRIETSVLVGIAAIAGLAILLVVVWNVLRFILRIPSVVAITSRARRRNKGYDALTRGMIAAAAGDTRYAARATRDAEKYLGEEPMTLLLRAQTAQLSGDRHTTETTFARMIERPETRLLGLRGLHAEARRRGDEEAAHIYAEQAHRIAPLGWAGDALLDYHVARQDWQRALDVVETNRTHKATNRRTADRQRAVLLTALARENGERDAEGSLRRAREAIKLAPDLVPAVEIAGRLMSRRGDLRKAARTLEAGWRQCTHPDLAAAYLDLRPGDSARDRLTRAETLARIAPGHEETRLTLARAELEAREFDRARRTIHPLVDLEAQARPTLRACLLMADIEEAEHGRDSGAVRQWLARAAHAPRDPVWIADGVMSDRWEPASPVTGKLDAFVWATPSERLAGAVPDRYLIEPQDETPDALPGAGIVALGGPAPAPDAAQDHTPAHAPEPEQPKVATGGQAAASLDKGAADKSAADRNAAEKSKPETIVMPDDAVVPEAVSVDEMAAISSAPDAADMTRDKPGPMGAEAKAPSDQKTSPRDEKAATAVAPSPVATPAATSPAPATEPARGDEKPAQSADKAAPAAAAAPARRNTSSALYPMPSIPDDPGPEPLEKANGARRFFS